MTEAEKTNEWMLYERGKNYNKKISPDLYTTVDKNERFYAGDHWRGVVANGLPTPVFNVIKRVINYQIATMMSQKVAMAYSAIDIGEEPQDESEERLLESSNILTGHSRVLWERLKMDSMLWNVLRDLAITGDACAFTYWDPDALGVGGEKGAMQTRLVDNVNVFFGNPNNPKAQEQPYIIVAARDTVESLKREAKKYGASDVETLKITSDSDVMEQSGDRGKVELNSYGGDDETAKTIALTKFWKDKEGYVHWKKSTKHCEIRKDVKTKLRLYPVAWCNWDERKNSYHGQSPITGMIPNQIFINKMFAMSMMSLMHTAFPKAVYDNTVISGWSNRIGEAIPVDGEVSGRAQYLSAGNMSSQVMQVIDQTLQYTKEMLGVTDAALGNVRPENTSAIIAVQRSAEVPLEKVKANLYQFVEDIGNIWFDFIAAYYGKRKIAVYAGDDKEIVEHDFDELQGKRLQTKIDVGPSSYWSEVASAATLDNLLMQGHLEFTQYLERMPEGLVPGRVSLIDEIERNNTKKQYMFELMARFMETLTEEQQAALAQMSPEDQEDTVLQMMMSSDWPNTEQQPQQQPGVDEMAQGAPRMEGSPSITPEQPGVQSGVPSSVPPFLAKEF